MRLPVFILIMLAAMLMVGVWSFVTDASIGTIVMRVAATAVSLQVAYFVLVAVSAMLPKSKVNTPEPKRPTSAGGGFAKNGVGTGGRNGGSHSP